MVLAHVQGMSRVPPDHPEGGAEGVFYSQGLCQDAPARNPHTHTAAILILALANPRRVRAPGLHPHKTALL
jgi:hypothetical protein